MIIDKRKALKNCLFFLMTIRFLLPAYFIEKIGSISLLIFLSIIFMGFYIFINAIGRKITFNIVTFFLILIYAVTIYSTIINNGKVYDAVFNALYVILLCLVIKLASKNEEDLNAFLHTVRNITLFFFIINIFIAFIYPNGIPEMTVSSTNPYFLYGNVNVTLKNIMPGLCCSLIIDSKKQRVVSIPTIIFILGFLYFSFSVYIMATGLVGLTLLVSLNIFRHTINQKIRLVYIALVIFVLFFEITIVFAGGNANFALAVNALFGKTDNFSGRGTLWTNCIRMIKNSSYLGYGLVDKDTLKYAIGNANGCHNYYLDVVFQRGIIGLIPMIILLILPAFIKIREYTSELYILITVCATYLLIFLTEPFIGTEVLHIPIFYITACLLIKEKLINSSQE